ncbi:hypothetical protein PG993_014203 [Apiospora rasikravindrae]|uniref:Uncharacterized protein n=1 Tax=Apiospora rasikravindrae TaxID=990691 RepID=A0ABR1RSK5_9PEZI
MPNSYKLTVINETGGPQDYAFFNDTPLVSGGVSGPVWSNVMKSAVHTPNGGRASFEVQNTFHATCGSFEGSPEHGGKITISKSVPVNLGSKAEGNVTAGSSVALTVYNKTSCDLEPPTTPGQGKLGNFQLTTTCKPENAFTMQDARQNNLLVGIATSGGGSITNAMASFAPYPNVEYQIMPKAIYHVAAGNRFNVGDLVKAEMMSNSIAVDFVLRGTNNVTLIHGQDMKFTFQ